jgi:quinoprotein dehydrogenase-associated probable ABC transporter substrate-binding protein
MRRLTDIALGLALLMALAPAAPAAVLRVCADPNDLPFSNRAGEGFENKIAELVAHDLGQSVQYTFAAQHQSFIRRTLNAQQCDVMIGVPVGLDEVDETRPYYASTYVFVYRTADNLQLSSLIDPRLRKLKLGVHLIGADDTPPELALGQQGIVDNVSGFMIYADTAQPNPPARLIEAVETRAIDVAAVWGPLGGYFAQRSPVALTVAPMTHTAAFAPLVFRYAIAMGVRRGDRARRDRLDGVLAREQTAIHAILEAYGVPLVQLKGGDHE